MTGKSMAFTEMKKKSCSLDAEGGLHSGFRDLDCRFFSSFLLLSPLHRNYSK